jgi:hypothetical protein
MPAFTKRRWRRIWSYSVLCKAPFPHNIMQTFHSGFYIYIYIYIPVQTNTVYTLYMITQSTQLLGLAKCKPVLLHKHENQFPVNYSLSPLYNPTYNHLELQPKLPSENWFKPQWEKSLKLHSKPHFYILLKQLSSYFTTESPLMWIPLNLLQGVYSTPTSYFQLMTR